METVIILGAGQFGRGAARLLNQENMALLAFGDNNPALHQLTESERTEKGFPANVPVLPVDEALSLKPDYIITGVTDPLRSGQLKDPQAHTAAAHESGSRRISVSAENL